MLMPAVVDMEVKPFHANTSSELLMCCFPICVPSVRGHKKTLDPMLPGADVGGVYADPILFEMEDCAGVVLDFV
eukprot:3278653-Ditylum_brightwellii.AAC.1